MKTLLIVVSFLVIAVPTFGQSERPQTIIVPTGSLGDISEVRKKMLEKTLESRLDDYFDIVPKDLFEEAQEKAFQELESDQCTEDQCIMLIKEILQVENAFQLILMAEEGDTQISLTWNDLDRKRVEEEYCEGCKTKELRESLSKLVSKLVDPSIVKTYVTEKKETPDRSKSLTSGTLYGEESEKLWYWSISKNSNTNGTYDGEILNNQPNGNGSLIWKDSSGGTNTYKGNWSNGLMHGQEEGRYSWGEFFIGEWKFGVMWNGSYFSKSGNILFKVIGGENTY